MLQILSQRDFTDSTIVKVSGAVRNTGDYFIDSNVTIETLINLSNGLTKEAKKYIAYVYRRYPNGATEVIQVQLTENSFKFLNGDELRILSERAFFDGATINVSGEVKIPLDLPYDKSINLAAVIELAGGLTFAGDSAQIAVYRMPFKGARIGQLEEYFLALPRDSEFSFQPYDAVVVRRKFGFKNQEYITLRGEFVYPGRYAIKTGETLKDIILKAGGLTNDAFPEAAEFIRVDKGKINVLIDKLISNSLTYDNIPVLNGDEIYVPTKDYTVRIVKANTQAENFSSTTSKDLHVSFIKGKSAKWYIKNLAGGYAENANRWKTTVIYANGSAKQTKPWRLVGKYPEVNAGSTIVVNEKSEKKKKEREDMDWQAFAQNLIAQATSVLTVWTLATKL